MGQRPGLSKLAGLVPRLNRVAVQVSSYFQPFGSTHWVPWQTVFGDEEYLLGTSLPHRSGLTLTVMRT